MLAHIATGVPAYGITTGLGYARRRRGLDRRPGRAAALASDGPCRRARRRRSRRRSSAARCSSGSPASSRRRGRHADALPVIADRLNDGWTPVVPSGPYGAAGEIGPLAHLFQTIIGRGTVVVVDGRRVPAARGTRLRRASSRTAAAEGGIALDQRLAVRDRARDLARGTRPTARRESDDGGRARRSR